MRERTSSYRGSEELWAQRTRGPDEKWEQRTSGYRGLEEQWEQRTRGLEDQWVQSTRGPVVTTDNFENEVERFSHRGYFTGELGNPMVLAMANVLKIPIVIFSSLENFPTIPILPCQQLHGMPSLFLSFNAAGCGHYDYVCREKLSLGTRRKDRRRNKEEIKTSEGVLLPWSQKERPRVSSKYLQ